ncbi:MAG TPA: hypothetical protein ENN68_00455 [Methanomicrobia archaeon]|mgnify:CR=1 FL=1|nr:hypothetical protein [Methanomicrobia archaeon]
MGRERSTEQRIQQKIYLSRKGLNSLEFEHEVLRIPLKAGEETSFEIIVINRGEPTHVHFSLSPRIRDKLMIMQDKVYVIETEKVAAMLRLPKSYAGVTDESTRGDIFVSSGYGASKRAFSVEIVESEELSARTEHADREAPIPAASSVAEKKEIVLTADEREFLSRLVISATVITIIFVLVVLMLYVGLFSNSPGALFVSALIAALLFLFLVLYNL